MQWVGHRYLGPGNKLDSGDPVDEDDVLAALHDLAYERGEVSQSDKHFARDFLQEYLTHGRIESLAGAIGLASKYFVERFTGQLYPGRTNMPRTNSGVTHRGHALYAERMRNVGAAWSEFKKKNPGSGLTYNKFRALHARTTSTESPQAPEPGPSSDDPMAEEPWEQLEAPMGETEDVVDAQTNGMSARGGGSRTSSTQNSGQLLTIPRSLALRKGHWTFGKSRIFYSYAYAYNQITAAVQTPDVGDTVYMTTPLAMLPNHLVGFYCDQYETSLLKLLPSRVVKATVTVVPQGLRAAFDTGTSLSGVATSEHVGIGVSAIALNHKMYIRGAGYTATATAPMIPTAIKDVDLKAIWLKYYGQTYKNADTNVPMNLGVPRHTDVYTVLQVNSNRKVTNYAGHDEGWYKLDQHVKRFNFLPHVGQKIIDWDYIPRNGYLRTKFHDVPCLVGERYGMWDAGFHNRLRRVAFASQKSDGNAYMEVENEISHEVGVYTVTQNTCIDDCTFTSPSFTNAPITATIPQIAMGLLPIPALNPATDQTNYLNASAYWSVVCSLTVEFNVESAFPLGAEAHAHPDNTIVHPDGYYQLTNMNEIEPFGLPIATATAPGKEHVATRPYNVSTTTRSTEDATRPPTAAVLNLKDIDKRIEQHIGQIKSTMQSLQRNVQSLQSRASTTQQ